MNCLHICSFGLVLLRLNCLTGLTAIQLRAETRNHPHEALWNSGLTSADSGLQLNLEIA